MALKADSKLNLTPEVTAKPVNDSFDFDVDVVDRRADKPKARTLELVLAAGNDLLFFPGKKKTVEQDETVGKDPVHVTFKAKTICGSGAGLSSFRVTLWEQGGAADLVFCYIDLK